MRASALILLLCLCCNPSFAGRCQGRFVNPITDICWRCLFPLSIGNNTIVKAANGLSDTPNPKHIIHQCGSRYGLQIGYWEPFALADVTDTPYCLVNLGGFSLAKSFKNGARYQVAGQSSHAFYHVHWYKYPLVYWLNLLTDAGCMEGGDFDMGWLSELDPTWNDDALAMITHPDAALFANPVAQTSCSADAIASSFTKKPMDKLFWCAGAQGSHYPLTGNTSHVTSAIQTAFLLTQRLNFKLHRFWLISDSRGRDGNTCKTYHHPVIPKSRYRYELVNQVADSRNCYPSGSNAMAMEAGRVKPNQKDQFGFLVWRKRNCTYL